MKFTTPFIVGIGLTFLLIIAFNFEFLSKFFFGEQNNLNPRGELLKISVQVIGGLVLILGAVYSLSIASAMNENNKLIEKGNISQRFKDAIDMLESKNSNTSLGGIYALHQIAKDNKEYKEQVFNVLTAYINTKTKDLPSWKDIKKPERFTIKPCIEIQTIVKLLFSKQDNIYKGFSATFENAKLYGADFSDLNFSKAIFKDVEIQNSVFKKTWFIKCHFVTVDFTFSDFTNANFTGAEFWNKSSFVCSGLMLSKFTGCFFQDTDFSCSRILANFDGSTITHCSFDGCEITCTDTVGRFNSATINVSAKGASCINGIIAKGLSKGLMLSDFSTNVKSRIGQYGELELEQKIEEFSTERLQELADLIDIDSHEKAIRHTIRQLKSKVMENTGLVFSDLSVLTKDDASEILHLYDSSINLIE